MAEKKINLLGEVCPFSLLRTQAEIKKISSGDVLLVETDFNQSARNILKWCDHQGYDFDLDEPESGIWLLTIRKS